jgi:hypothetical protein
MKVKCLRLTVVAFCGLVSTSLLAADFDGSRKLLCATVDAHACDPGAVCLRGLPTELGAPQFLRIDFAKKAVVGPARATPIRLMESTEHQILLQGTELGFAWTVVLDKDDGTMTVALVNRDDAFLLFGACTPD